MDNIKKLMNNYGQRLKEVNSRADIPESVPLVYILLWGDQALVVGEGKKNRARVITDDTDSITSNHKKAIKVRLYRLYGGENKRFSSYMIYCKSKSEAQEIEKKIHSMIGGNNSSIDSKILEELFRGLTDQSLVRIFLQQALCSAFDGIYDLKKWRREGIIKDDEWAELCKRLRITYMMPNKENSL